jgi:hypothetical protein
MLNRSPFVKKFLFVCTLGLFVLPSVGRAQNVAQTAARSATPKQLTIEQIFAEGGVTGRAPETINWSPDGTKLTFVQREKSAGQRD